MPVTLSAIGLALFQAGASAAFATAVATFSITAFAVNVGLSVGLSFLAQALTPKPSQPKPEDIQQSFRQSTPPRIRFYGVNRASGPWLFGESKQGNFHKVIAIAHGEIDGIDEFWIDDNLVTLDVSGNVQGSPYNSAAKIEYRLGLPSETAYASLVAEFPEYTNLHRGDGIASLYAYQKALSSSGYQRIFPQGINTLYRIVFRGSKIKNISSGITEYDDNAASVILDYMTHPDGMRLPTNIFETPEATAGWLEAYNRSDVAFNVKAGGTEPQYRLWGSYSLQERPGDVLSRMMASCDARIYPTSDGGVRLDIGEWYEPTVIIGPDEITGFSGFSRGRDIIDSANTVKASFIDPDSEYLTTDADPWVDAADVTERGERIVDTSFPMAPSHSQTRRLMKKFYYRSNPEWVGQFTLNLAGLACLGERFIRIQYPDFGVDEVFEVQNLEFIFGEEGILQAVSISVISMPQEAYQWNNATEEGEKPQTTDTEVVSVIPVPTNFLVTIDRINVGSNLAPFGILTFDAPPSAALVTQARYKKTSDVTWITITVTEGATEAQSQVLDDGVEYEFQVRHVSIAGSQGDWTPSALITPTADETAPDPVSSVSAADSVGSVDLAWTTPNSANFNRTIIRRNTVDDEGLATVANVIYGTASTAVTYTDDSLASGDYYYWIYAANASGVESASIATGLVTVT